MQNLRKFRATFFFFFSEADVARPRPKSARRGQNQHVQCQRQGQNVPTACHTKAPTCPSQGTNALALPMPRHQRVQLAHTKAPTCPRQGQNLPTACPRQGTNGWGLPTPRHQRVRHAHAKATLDGGSHRRGGQRSPPPPKEVLKHLQVCQEGTHLVLERSPSRIKTSFVGIFS